VITDGYGKKGVMMKKLDKDFLCEHCRFSIAKLMEMAEKGGRKEMFTTFGGQNK